MNDITNKTGEFWSIESGQDKFKGKIYIKNNYIYLKTNLDKSLQENYLKITDLIGKIDDIPVTLHKVHLSCNYDTLIFMAEYLFKNHGSCDLSFKKVKFKFDYLDDWITNSAYVLNIDKLKATCEIPNKTLNLEDSTLTLLFEDIINKTSRKPMINFKMLLNYSNEKLFEDILKDIDIVKNFFMFSIYSKINLKEVTIIMENDYEINIYSSFSIRKDVEIYNWFNVIMQYHEIEDDLENILKNWINSYDTFKPFFDIYFLNVISKLYPEALLITYVESLEFFMRKNEIFNDKFMEEEEFKEIFNELNEVIDSLQITDDHKSSLNSRIKYGYEYTLRKRLKDLFKKLDKYEVIRELVGEYGKPNDFINIVVFTRNYYTHYGDKNKYVKYGKELMSLDLTLRLIIDLCLLNELKLPEDYINTIIRKKLKYFPKLI